MRKKRFGFLTVVSFLAWAWAPGGGAQTRSASFDRVYLGNLERQPLEYVEGQVVVGFDASVTDQEASSIALGAGGSIRRVASRRAFRVLSVPRGRVWQAIEQLKRNPRVRYAHPDWLAHATQVTPNDPLYPLQWNFDNPVHGGIYAKNAWEVSPGGDPAVVVAILDTGIAYENFGAFCQSPDLAGTTFVPGWDFINGDAHPNDDNSHGTHVAGTIAQTTNNAVGVAGIAYRTSLMPVKVLNASGTGTISGIADGIRWATDHGARIINMSLSTSASPIFLGALQDAVSYAASNGVLLVAAAGNSSGTSPQYPAAYPEVLAVAATKYDDTPASYTNWGDICAPGGTSTGEDLDGDGHPDMILQSTFDPNTKQVCDLNYWFFAGTSMASPHVAGVAALVMAEDSTLTAAEVRQVLLDTANNAVAPACGVGLLDAGAALDRVAGGDHPPVVSILSPRNGDVVSGARTIQIAASDDMALESVEWSVDGGVWKTASATSNAGVFDDVWDTTTAGEDQPHVLRARATDDAMQTTESATVTVTVNNDNQAPQAAFVFTCSGSVCSFDASGSQDPDSLLTGFAWSFGDGRTGAGKTVSHTFAAAGTYSVSLTVTDDLGKEGTVSHDVVIQQATNTMHVADLDGLGQKLRFGIWSASVTVTVRNAAGNPVGNAQVSGLFDDGSSLFNCTTAGTGTCTVVGYQWFRRCLTFTVTTVSHPSLTYQAADNGDPDGDSNGTSITVCKP